MLDIWLSCFMAIDGGLAWLRGSLRSPRFFVLAVGKNGLTPAKTTEFPGNGPKEQRTLGRFQIYKGIIRHGAVVLLSHSLFRANPFCSCWHYLPSPPLANIHPYSTTTNLSTKHENSISNHIDGIYHWWHRHAATGADEGIESNRKASSVFTISWFVNVRSSPQHGHLHNSYNMVPQ